jgi:hypothetical protein
MVLIQNSQEHGCHRNNKVVQSLKNKVQITSNERQSAVVRLKQHVQLGKLEPMPGIEQVKWDLGYKFIRVNFSKPM